MNEIAKTKHTTPLSVWATDLTKMVSQDYTECGMELDEYSRKCAMAAMTTIYQLVKNASIDISKMDMSNLREIVGQCASLKLNANAIPRECYFQLRKKNINDVWINTVEMGIEGDGNDAILRNFGENVETVYPVWIIKEGDTYTPPKHKGLELTPPEWEENGLSQKTVRVVYPVKLTDGTVIYLTADRESVKTNLFAHVRNNLMNETFGVIKGTKKTAYGKETARTRYDATDAEKAEISAKKNEVYDALRACETLDDMLNCEAARPYISAAWLDTPEAMIVRKMRNNAIKKYKKNYDTMAKRAYLQTDEVYQAAQAEIAENANQVDFEEPELQEVT